MTDTDAAARQGGPPAGRHRQPGPPEPARTADLDELTRVIRAQGVGAHPANRSAAIAALAGRADTADLVQEVACSELEDLAVRTTAIGALANLAQGDAENRLLPLCHDPNPVIRIKALRKLAAIGSRPAYDMASGTDADVHAAKQARFTRAVIAHRLDLDDDALADVAAPGTRRPSGDLADVDLRVLTPEETTARLGTTFGDTYGVRPARDLAFELAIGGARWFVAVDESAIVSGELRPSLDRKQVLAVFALWDEETGRYHTQHVALTRPRPSGGLRMVVLRSDGEVVHVGTLEVRRDGVRFASSSTTRRGATPGSLSGTVSRAEVSLARAVVAASRRRKNRVRPLQM